MLENKESFLKVLSPINREPAKRTIYVGMDQQNFAETGTIETDGVTTCVAIAVKDQNQVFLAHWNDPTNQEELSMLQDVIESSEDVQKLKIYIRGGAPFSEESEDAEAAKITRQVLLESLESFGVLDDQIDVIWLDSPKQGTYMKVGVDTDLFESRNYSIDDEIESYRDAA